MKATEILKLSWERYCTNAKGFGRKIVIEELGFNKSRKPPILVELQGRLEFG